MLGLGALKVQLRNAVTTMPNSETRNGRLEIENPFNNASLSEHLSDRAVDTEAPGIILRHVHDKTSKFTHPQYLINKACIVLLLCPSRIKSVA